MKKFFLILVLAITTCLQAAPTISVFPIESPRKEGYLQVSEKHQIFYALYGNPEGIPVVVLHGGPGLGTSDSISRFFDLKRFNVVMFDQRGAMRSKPFACMEENTTQLLIEDIETLRKHLAIKQWMVFGGSWGSLLAVLYGEAHPEACLGFILRGIFLGRKEDIRLGFEGKEGSEDAYQEFLLNFTKEQQADLLTASYEKIIKPDPSVHIPFARAFIRYHIAHTTKSPNWTQLEPFLKNDQLMVSMARAVLHYSIHQLFLYPNQTLAEIGAITHIPAIIIQGNGDINCLPEQAILLHQNWKNSRLVLVEGGGHSENDPLIASAIVEATESFANSLEK